MTKWTAESRAKYRQAVGYGKVTRVRKLLRNLPDSMTKRVKKEIDRGSKIILFDMIKFVPKDFGTLASLLSYKVGRDGLSSKIGLRGKKANRRGFYAKFLEHGVKAHSRRRKRDGTWGRSNPARAARPFMEPAFENNRSHLIGRVSKAVHKAIMAGGKTPVQNYSPYSK